MFLDLQFLLISLKIGNVRTDFIFTEINRNTCEKI